MRLQRYILVEFLKSLGLAAAVFLAFMFVQTMIKTAQIGEKVGADMFSVFPAVPYFLP